MPTEAYLKYGQPQEPADPNANEMTIQETAWVLKISVSHAYRLIRRTGLGSKPGRRVITTREDREALVEMNHLGGRPARRPARRRKSAAPKPARTAKTPAAA